VRKCNSDPEHRYSRNRGRTKSLRFTHDTVFSHVFELVVTFSYSGKTHVCKAINAVLLFLTWFSRWNLSLHRRVNSMMHCSTAVPSHPLFSSIHLLFYRRCCRPTSTSYCMSIACRAMVVGADGRGGVRGGATKRAVQDAVMRLVIDCLELESERS
jgi:hypothetical protein